MAAVLDQKQDPAAKFDSKVDEQLAEATSRIRFHDLTFGALLVSALALAYFAGMIVLDKYLVLPEWVRQLALAGFVAVAGSVAWFTVIRPLRREINPLYAAVQVERTVDDAKNSVAGYVDAKTNEHVHPTVRTAMGARAAKSVGEADLNQAVDHRSLLYVGAVVIALVLALVVLFFVFRPTQFTSLAGRTFLPFSSSAIATRTQLTLVKPDPADATVTSGQAVTIGVHVGGKLPNADGPERVRVLLRHNPADPNYEVVPMEVGESSRDWQIRVPDYLVQNGFWYKVAAGDAETTEHKITVRSAPLVTDFDVTYEFPAYLRMKPATSKDNRLLAFRGTKVTLIAKTNREVKDGRMDVEPTGEKVPGKPAANRPDSLRFEYKLVESGTYRLHFTATNGERNADPAPFGIQVIADQAPNILITKPEEDELPLPANGQLAVDATIGDDFGIEKVVLKIKLEGENGRVFADKPYLDGKSFLRPTDNTWPTSLEYKDSVDFAQLKDAAGLPADLKEGMVLEYWLEATDNCTEPKANVGKSKVKRVRLTAPKVEPERKQQQDADKQQRKNEEQQHNANQQKKLDNEERKPPQNPNQQQDPNQQKQEGNGDKNETPKNEGKNDTGEKKNDQGNTSEKKNDTPEKGTGEKKNDKGSNDPTGKPPEGMDQKNDTNPMKGDNQQKGDNNPMKGDNTPKGDNTQKGMNDPMGGMGNSDNKGGMSEAPMPREQGKKSPEEEAAKVQDEIDKQNKSEGGGKGNPGANTNDRTEPSAPKPQPMDGKGEDGQPKQPPKPNDPMNPMNGEKNNASESKGEGNLQQPPDPSTPKPNDPKNPNGQKGNASDTKSEPIGAPPGEDKPEPKNGGMNEQNADKKNEDPNSGVQGKPASKKPAGEQPKNGGMEQPDPNNQQQDPAGGAGESKPMGEQSRGSDKETKPQGGTPQPKDKQPDAGDSKPQQRPQEGAGKPQPNDKQPPQDATKPKPPPAGMNDPMMQQPGNAAEQKPDRANPQDKGIDKGQDKEEANAQANKDAKKDGTPKGGNDGGKPEGKKLDPKEIADAAKDLNSNDPKKQQEARDKLDKQFGKENREAAEKLAKDLQSDDKATREAAEKKLNDMKQKAEEQAKKNGENKNGGEPKAGGQDVENAIKDLQSPDQKTRDAAKEKLDKELGEKGRQQAEDIAKDLKSDDANKRAEAQKKLDNLKQQANEMAKKDGGKDGKPEGKKLSKEEAADLAKKAQDLGSKDDAKRQQAEKEFDEKFGKENREKLQDIAKDMQSGDPEKMKKAQEKLQAMAESLKDLGKRGDVTPTAPPKDNRTILEDARKRLESAQLQLEKFEKNRDNKELQERLGMNPDDYDRFLKGQEQRVKDLEKDVAKAEQEAEKPLPPPGAAKTNIGSAGKVVGREGPSGAANAGGTTFAPPGFGKAAEAFRQDAAKLGTTPKNK